LHTLAHVAEVQLGSRVETRRSARERIEHANRRVRKNQARGLAREQDEEAPMAAKKTAGKAKRVVKPVPRGYRTVTATLNQKDASQTIAFMKKAFGAKLRGKAMKGPGGKIMHAEIEIGDSVVMVSDAVMDPPRQGAMFLYVPNVDKTVAKAVKAGATITMPPMDMFWGDRFGRVSDPQGNVWAVASRVENVSPKEMEKRSKAEAE
jgi:PhnB protein